MLTVICIGLLFMSMTIYGQTPSSNSSTSITAPEKVGGFPPFPREISYQGLLTTGSGVPATDGSYTLQFDLFSILSGGVSLWTETQSGVSIQKGVFSARLGSVTPLPNYFYQELYVEVTATAGPGIVGPIVFSPRTKLAATPYSLGPWQSGNNTIYYLYGNVGIGTQSPTEKFTIDGDNDQFFISSTSDGIADVDYQSGSDPVWAVGTGWGGAVDGKTSFFWYNLGEQMSLTSNGELSVRSVSADDTVMAQSFRYTTPQTGYISGSGFTEGRGLTSSESYAYSSGVYNNGTGSQQFEVPLHLPDGVTLNSLNVYVSDADATQEAIASFFQHNLSANTFLPNINSSSGIAFAGGNITLAIAPNIVVNNFQYAYSFQVRLPNTINVHYIGYRATFTYDNPGVATSPKNRPSVDAGRSTIGSAGPASNDR